MQITWKDSRQGADPLLPGTGSQVVKSSDCGPFFSLVPHFLPAKREWSHGRVPSSGLEQQLVLQHQELRSLFHMSHQLPARIRDYSSLPETLLSPPSNHIKSFAQASYFLLLRLLFQRHKVFWLRNLPSAATLPTKHRVVGLSSVLSQVTSSILLTK